MEINQTAMLARLQGQEKVANLTADPHSTAFYREAFVQQLWTEKLILEPTQYFIAND